MEACDAYDRHVHDEGGKGTGGGDDEELQIRARSAQGTQTERRRGPRGLSFDFVCKIEGQTETQGPRKTTCCCRSRDFETAENEQLYVIISISGNYEGPERGRSRIDEYDQSRHRAAAVSARGGGLSLLLLHL